MWSNDPPNRYENACADEPGAQMTGPTGRAHAEDCKKGVRHRRSGDAEDDVHRQDPATLQKPLSSGNPTHSSAPS